MLGDVLTSYTVYGLIASATFQQCTEVAAYLNRTYPESYAVAIEHEVPRDYEERRAKWITARQLSDDKHNSDVLVHNGTTNELITGEQFVSHVERTTNYRVDPSMLVASNHNSYSARAQQGWLDFLAARDRQYCWLEVTIDGVAVGKIWLELFSSLAPLTCKNFCELCRGISVDLSAAMSIANSNCHITPSSVGSSAPQIGSNTRTLLTYKGTSFFRTLKDAWVMAGDVTGDHSGTGGYSCYGRTFPDETFAVLHDAAGVLGMCNDGPHTNASSFYITRRPLSWMNRKYVAFGRVMDGMTVLDAIHAVEVKHNQSPVAKIMIADCGVLDPSE